eukprot:2544793-Rhodomonas_salina.2
MPERRAHGDMEQFPRFPGRFRLVALQVPAFRLHTLFRQVGLHVLVLLFPMLFHTSACVAGSEPNKPLTAKTIKANRYPDRYLLEPLAIPPLDVLPRSVPRTEVDLEQRVEEDRRVHDHESRVQERHPPVTERSWGRLLHDKDQSICSNTTQR